VASIQVIQGPDKGRTFELSNSENVIGRVSPSVQLNDSTVSRRHARLVPEDSHWVIEDMGSANGTYVNGVRLTQPLRVHGGDQIRCGSTLLVFGGGTVRATVDVDEDGQLIDVAIIATIPSNEDSVIIPTPEAGAEAIGNLRILYDLSADMGSIFNVDTLLHRTLDKIFELVRADRGYIMLIDEKGKLTLKASRLAEGYTGKKVPISRTIINEVVSQEVGVLSNNAMSDKRFAAGKSVHDFRIHSAVCAPIKGRERILGVIHVDCSISEYSYSTEQLRLLTAIGFQTGLAVENVRLYESTVQSERLAAVGETVASLSHHIKNILQALGAGTDLVEMNLERDDLGSAKQAWPIVQRNLERINTMILNMLAFSKDREPLLENININQVLTDCVDLFTPKADERAVAVLTDFDDVPPIPADMSGLRVGIMNLLTNALEAVEDNTGVVTVTSRYDSMNRDVLIGVADNGGGIPGEQVDQVFDPFWSSKGQGGTGLGLTVTQKVVREHQGQIDVRSRVGEGTTFTITLPAIMVGSAGETAGPPK